MRLYTGLTCKDQTAIHTPLIEIRGLEDDTLLQQAAASITDHDILLMTSRMTVKYWYEAMQKVKAPWHGQVVAIEHTMPGHCKREAHKTSLSLLKTILMGLSNYSVQTKDFYIATLYFHDQP